MKERILNIGNIFSSLYFMAVSVVFLFLPSIGYRGSSKLVGIAAVIAIVIIYSLISRKPPVTDRISVRCLYIVCAVIMLAADIVIAVSLKFTPVTDAGFMDTICRNFVEGRELYEGLHEYFSHYLDNYSNQWGLFLIQSSIYGAAHLLFGRIPQLTTSFAAIAVMQISYFLMYKLAGKIFGNGIQIKLFMVLIFLNPVLYAYSCIFYTDMLSMPFVLGALYLGISAFGSRTRKRFVILTCLTALCIGAGYCIKGSVAVIAVALVIYAAFRLSWKRTLSLAAALVVVFAVNIFVVERITFATGAVTEQSIEKYGFPTSHWIMMGLSGRGGYDEEIFVFTFCQPDKQARHEASIQVIKDTLSDYGASGMAKHLVTKLRYTWFSGLYQITWQLQATPYGYLQSFFTSSSVFFKACYAFQFFMIFFMTVSCVSSAIHRRTDPMFVIRLTVFGLGLFLLIWETRSRYMLNMLPLFIMISVDGLEQFSRFIESVKKRIKK